MENFINNVKNVVSLDVLIYIVIALVAIVILTIIMMVLRQKQARKQLDELELSYNSLKGIPLAFKLNKAVALSRVNEEMSQRVESCRTDFDNIQEQLKECSVTLAEADDLIYVHKAKAAKRRMGEAAGTDGRAGGCRKGCQSGTGQHFGAGKRAACTYQ